DPAYPQARANWLEPGRLRRAGERRRGGAHLQGGGRAAGPPVGGGERPQRRDTPRRARIPADAGGCDGGVREESRAEVGLMPKSSIPKRTIRLNGRKTGVTVEDQFWNALKEIAIKRDIYLSDLVAEINEQRGHGNLS